MWVIFSGPDRMSNIFFGVTGLNMKNGKIATGYEAFLRILVQIHRFKMPQKCMITTIYAPDPRAVTFLHLYLEGYMVRLSLRSTMSRVVTFLKRVFYHRNYIK